MGLLGLGKVHEPEMRIRGPGLRRVVLGPELQKGKFPGEERGR